MRTAFAIFLLSAISGPAGAIEITGGDWHGGPLKPAHYDILRGTFTNVSSFTITAGDTVLVAPGERLTVYAATVTIAGHLNASGSGLPGGAAGGNNLPGSDGFGPVLNGAGKGGDETYGGGGGGHADADADTAGGGRGEPAGLGGLGGIEYDLNSGFDIPLSPADAFLGSGGGGGGGGGPGGQAGGGGAGGGAVYIEAGYVVVSGTISADGLVGGVGITIDDSVLAAGGGGGAGGSILIKSAGLLNLSSGRLSSSGGGGGSAMNNDAPTPNPGGGGAAGRVRLIYNNADFSGVRISTSYGAGGESNFGLGSSAQAGSSGTVSFGLLPSSPAAFAVTAVFKTSATYSWTGKAGGEWGGPVSAGLPALTTSQFRLYSSTTAAPFAAYYTGFSTIPAAATLTETGLSPDTVMIRMLTAYTDYGDSAPSAAVSTITHAAPPQGEDFPSASTGSVVFQWSSGTVAEGFNPAYTSYEIDRSSVPGFASAVHTALTVGVSSAPAGLEPNTTYYFRARALGLDAAYTGYTQEFSTPTLALSPVDPALDEVSISSMLFSWSGAGNPPGTIFEAQVSEDNFLSVKDSSLTSSNNASFGSLTPGVIYYLRARALNHAGRRTGFTLALSTTVGQLGNLEAPGRPEPPNPASAYAYDGAAVFVWAPPAGAVPIFEYLLDIGSTPGGNDFLSGHPVPASGSLSYSTNTLVSGKTYYARVRARSTAGVLGEFSLPGAGVAVWAPQAQPAITKPYNWPNPFDPRQAPTNIGFNLSAPAKVTLTVYTLQGRRVREISAPESSGGNKVWNWDGRNGEGRVVEPGGYLAVIRKDYASGSETQRFKLAVLY